MDFELWPAALAGAIGGALMYGMRSARPGVPWTLNIVPHMRAMSIFRSTPSADLATNVLDYGRHEVASDSLGLEQALLVALRELKEQFMEGWPLATADGERVQPGQVFIDAGYANTAVYAFCRESGERFRPAVGRGAAQQHRQWYNRPTQTGSVVKYIGEGYHANWLLAEQLLLVEADADHWKTWVHQRLSTPVGKAGAPTLFRALPSEHLPLAKHLTAETKTEEFVAGKGVVVKWERIRRQNHWLDALYNACCAGHACGVRLVDERVEEPPPPAREEGPGPLAWLFNYRGKH